MSRCGFCWVLFLMIEVFFKDMGQFFGQAQNFSWWFFSITSNLLLILVTRFQKIKISIELFWSRVYFSETDELFKITLFIFFLTPPSKPKSRPRSSPRFLCSRSLFIYIGLHFNLLDQPFTLTKRSRRQHFYSIKINYTTHPLLKYSLTPL